MKTAVQMCQRYAPIPWFGGKQTRIPQLLAVLPPHHTFVEVCGGSGAVLFAKTPSRVEVYNDVDQGLCHFYRVLRDPDTAARLQQQLILTPYARAEYRECLATWQDTHDAVERARRWYVVARQSFSGRFGSGWGFMRRHPERGKHAVHNFRQAVADLPRFVTRLAEVLIESQDFAAILSTYDAPDCLFFVDPPYLDETRRAGGYAHEMSHADHERLLQHLNRVRGMVVLTGYRHVMYDDILRGWHCQRHMVTCHAAGRTRASHLQGQGNVRAHQRREELVWLNPAAAQALAT